MKIAVSILSDLWFQEGMINTIAYLYHTNNISTYNIDNKIPRNNILSATYILDSVIHKYEPHLWHINYVGLREAANAFLIVNEYENYFVVSPDNSFSFLLDLPKPIKRYCVSYIDANGISNHYTYTQKIIALIIHYQNGKNIDDFTSLSHQPFIQHPPLPMIKENAIEGRIIHINYDNSIVINIKKDTFERARKGRSFHYEYLSDEFIRTLSKNPYDVKDNEHKNYILFNHAGYMEIGSYAQKFTRLLEIGRFSLTNYIDADFTRTIGKIKIRINFE